MHNGVLGGFHRVRRALLDTLSDAAYNTVQSFHSDSAVAFSVFLNELARVAAATHAQQQAQQQERAQQQGGGGGGGGSPRATGGGGGGLSSSVLAAATSSGQAARGLDAAALLAGQQPPEVLMLAMQATVATITRVQREVGAGDQPSLLNFVVSDGATLVASRFVLPEGAAAASLYYAEGAAFERQAPEMQQQQQQAGEAASAVPPPQAPSSPPHGPSAAQQAAVKAAAGVAGIEDAKLMAADPCAAAAAASVADQQHQQQAQQQQQATGGAASGGGSCKPGGGGGSGNSAAPATTAALVGSSVLQEADYALAHGPRGARVAMVASEPITGSTTDWIVVPKNVALVVTREKGGFLSVLRAPLRAGVPSSAASPSPERPLLLPLAAEVAAALEAISRGLTAKSRPWTAPRALSLGRRRSQPGGGGKQPPLMLQDPPSPGAARRLLAGGGGSSPSAATAANGGGGGAFAALAAQQQHQHQHHQPQQQADGSMGPAHLEEEHRLTGHAGAVLCLAQDAAAGLAWSGGADGAVRLWDLDAMACVAQLPSGAHTKPVTHLALTHGGHRLLTASGVAVRAWDVSALRGAAARAAGFGGAPGTALPPSSAAAPLPEPVLLACVRTSAGAGCVRALVALPDGGTVLVSHQDMTVKRFRLGVGGVEGGGGGASGGGTASDAPLSSSSALPPLPPRPPPLQSFAVPSTYHPPEAETDAMSPSAHVGPVNALAVCGAYVVSAGGDATVRVWRASDLSFVRALRGHRGSVLCLLAVGSGGMVLSGARDNTVRVWDLGMDGVCRRTLLGHKDDVVALAAVGVRRRFGGGGGAGGGGGGFGGCGGFGSGILFDGGASQQQQAPAHASASDLALARCVSPGPLSGGAAALVASASADGSVRVWSSSWTCLAVLMPNVSAPWGGMGAGSSPFGNGADGPLSPPSPAWASPRARFAECASSSDRAATPLLWSAAAAAQQAAAEPPSVLTVAVSPDHVTAGFADATVRTWHLDDVFMAAADLELMLPPNAAADGLLARTLSHTFTAGGGGGGAGASAVGGSSPVAALAQPPSLAAGGGNNLSTIQLSPSDGALLAGLTLADGGAGAAPSGAAHDHHHTHLHLATIASPQPPPTAPGSADPSCPAAAVADAAVAAARHAAPPCARRLGQASATTAVPPSPGCPCLVCGSQDHSLVRALRDFVAIRTVSSDRKQRDECLRGAKFLANALESLGAEVKVVTPPVAAPDGSTPLPVVMGRLFRDARYPTLVFYGHYDVQPAEEPDWRTPPFSLVAADGYLYGRGTSDNKGPVLAFIHAVREMHECWRASGAGAPPVNVAFVFEGEEENGSTGFREALAANRGWFSMAAAAVEEGEGGGGAAASAVNGGGDASAATTSAPALGVLGGSGGSGGIGSGNNDNSSAIPTAAAPSLVVVSNTVWVGERRPCLTYGMRGMITLSIEVSGPDRDVHSGNDGGVFVEPMADLVKLLASLTEPGSPTIAVDGFYDAVRAALVDLAWESLRKDPGEFDAEAYREAIGVRALSLPKHLHGRGGEAEACCGCGGGEPAVAAETREGLEHDVLTARWCQPSLSVIDVRVGEGAVAPGTLVGGCGLGASEQEDGDIAARGREALRQGLRGPCGGGGGAEAAAAAVAAAVRGGVAPASSTLPHTPEPRHHYEPGRSDSSGAMVGLGGGGDMGGGARGGGGGGNNAAAAANAALSGNYFPARGAAQSGAASGGRPRASPSSSSQHHGNRSCYSFGPTRFSVIPRVAAGKVSVRFVPEQDAAALIEALARHVESAFRRIGSPANRVAVRVHSVGDWWEADTASRYFAMAERAVAREWGAAPLYVREGGTMPVAGVIEAVLGAPALLIPLGQSSDACHLPNERIRRANLVRGKNVFRHLLEEVAAKGRGAAPGG
jgi:acetylornithine deacetylase/succinyl-diaminopimelate desuccinylase-like protein/WD40 repeat protein